MAVADILKALSGGAYTPTGVYSVEFRQKSGAFITEVFFMLPPESVTVSESQRSDLQKTLTGGYLADFGNEFKDIEVEGSTHFYYAGTTKNPSSEYGRSSNLGVVGFIDGYTEFIKLRFMLMRYRDYTMTRDSKLLAPDLSLPEIAATQALKDFVNKAIQDGDGALADYVEVIWHDYDYDDHFKVKVDKFTASRSKEDPWSVKYNITMIGYAVDDRKSAQIKLSRPTRNKPTPIQQIQSVYRLTGEVHSQTIPTTVSVNTASSTLLLPNFTSQDTENPPSTLNVEGF